MRFWWCVSGRKGLYLRELVETLFCTPFPLIHPVHSFLHCFVLRATDSVFCCLSCTQPTHPYTPLQYVLLNSFVKVSSCLPCPSELAVLLFVPLLSVLLVHSTGLSGGSPLRDSLFFEVCLSSPLLLCSIVHPESSHLVLMNSSSAQPSLLLRQQVFCQLFLQLLFFKFHLRLV